MDESSLLHLHPCIGISAEEDDRRNLLKINAIVVAWKKTTAIPFSLVFASNRFLCAISRKQLYFLSNPITPGQLVKVRTAGISLILANATN